MIRHNSSAWISLLRSPQLNCLGKRKPSSALVCGRRSITALHLPVVSRTLPVDGRVGVWTILGPAVLLHVGNEASGHGLDRLPHLFPQHVLQRWDFLRLYPTRCAFGRKRNRIQLIDQDLPVGKKYLDERLGVVLDL